MTHFRTAVISAILGATIAFAAVSLNMGIGSWFSERTQTATNSADAADAYVEAHKQVIRGDILAMALDLNRAAPLVQGDQKRIVEILETEARTRALPAVYVTDSTGRTLVSAKLPDVPAPNPATPRQIEQAKNGPVVLVDASKNMVLALIRLNAFRDTYLLVDRPVNPQVLAEARTSRF
jgi:two-component system nitrogen regulation sensor histidine kinase NtrY